MIICHGFCSFFGCNHVMGIILFTLVLQETGVFENPQLVMTVSVLVYELF
jgi:hypothetical protein